MRRTRFRVWHTGEKTMYYDPLINGLTGEVCICDQGEITGVYDIETVIPLQYTGLKDKNGRGCYEGDILEAEHKLKTQKFKRKYQVIFNEKGYWDAISLDDKPIRLCYAGFDKCEVVGNIYEDPDLLEGSLYMT